MKKQKITVTIDRKIGTFHPKYNDMLYELNYGYIKGIFAPDNEEQDAYILGIYEPLDHFTGELIAIIHRNDDIETKWIVAPTGTSFTEEEIIAQTYFQEKFFDILVEML